MAAEKSSSSVNSVVANVLKLAKKGGPLGNVGVRGRLGDLASIHSDFDVAVRYGYSQRPLYKLDENSSSHDLCLKIKSVIFYLPQIAPLALFSTTLWLTRPKGLRRA